MQALCLWLSVLAMVLVPMVMSLTHSPAAATAADEALWHGHFPGEAAMAPLAGHDATDHEHQLHGLLQPAGGATELEAGRVRGMPALLPSGAIREGPRRPPRRV